MLKRYIIRARAWLQSGARTVGLSPKALAPAIGAGITAGLNAAGITPHDLGQVFAVSDAVAAGALTTVASAIAVWLLPPGQVATPPAIVGDGSDARLSDEARAHIDA